MRLSLFWPGRAAVALVRLDLAVAAVLWVAAVITRWRIIDAGAIWDEPAHFLLARGLWTAEPGWRSIHEVDLSVNWMFWQRPMFSLLLWPGAAISFEAYRGLHILIASLAPALTWLLLRRFGVEAWLALPAALVLVLHPMFVIWGMYVLPDSLMLVLTLAGLHLAHSGRPVLTAIFLLSAAWTKEVAIVTPLVLLALAWWTESDRTRPRGWPVALGPFGASMLAVVAFAFVPLVYSLTLEWARFPGWLRGGDPLVVLERIFVLVWFAPVVALGLAHARSRRVAVVAVAWSGFFVVYRILFDRHVNIHYMPGPGALSVLAAALALSAAWQAWPRPRRLAIPATALVLACLVGVQVLAPSTSALNQRLVAPLSGQGQWNLEETYEWTPFHDYELVEILALIPEQDRDVFAVDVHYSFVLWQMQERFDIVYAESAAMALIFRNDLHPWVDAMENGTADIVILGRDSPNPLNQAIRDAYASCVEHEVGEFIAIRASACKGDGWSIPSRTSEFWAEWDAQ